MGKQVSESTNTYRVGHPLAQRLLDQAKDLPTPPHELTFEYSNSGKRIAVLDTLKGKSGWLICSQFTIHALEVEDHLMLSGFIEDGKSMDEKQIQRLLDLPAVLGNETTVPAIMDTRLSEEQTRKQNILLEELTLRNGNWFEIEIDKLDHWADDRRSSFAGRVG
jgi:hypothetical protein